MMSLAEFINTFAVPLGALSIGCLSGLIARIAPAPKTPGVRFWFVYVIPFSLAILLYLLPIWDKGTLPHLGWDVIAIFMWTTPGVVVSTLIIDYKERRSKNQNDSAPNP